MAYSKPMSILAETAPLLALQVAPEDDVAVALRPLEAGQTVRVGMVDVPLRDPVPAGHKFALHDIAADAPVRRERDGDARPERFAVEDDAGQIVGR